MGITRRAKNLFCPSPETRSIDAGGSDHESAIIRGLSISEDFGPAVHAEYTVPRNKLSDEERSRLLETVNAPEFRDRSPKQFVPELATRGCYVASESTMYHVLREEDQLQHRERTRPPTKRHKSDELRAGGPNELWSWDITSYVSFCQRITCAIKTFSVSSRRV